MSENIELMGVYTGEDASGDPMVEFRKEATRELVIKGKLAQIACLSADTVTTAAVFGIDADLLDQLPEDTREAYWRDLCEWLEDVARQIRKARENHERKMTPHNAQMLDETFDQWRSLREDDRQHDIRVEHTINAFLDFIKEEATQPNDMMEHPEVVIDALRLTANFIRDRFAAGKRMAQPV